MPGIIVRGPIKEKPIEITIEETEKEVQPNIVETQSVEPPVDEKPKRTRKAKSA